ncbi:MULTISPECIES: YpfB family protein [unclassified Bacillus (in: firmicutes)]|uniref:YpfB family protein n=1 Tax=unclassified Bacillus (in: firmicutes) TaxID=185979 RepID=UPI000E3B90BD|nr:MULTISPECIES: YpfB family protein [unclassified Bacillus (in: firmicutes)]RFU69079.1 hypothetical protein D0463_03325 [Bacillus sp. V59.32b]CAH0345564.1 hypothetical protein BCI9360_01852 [Bacillus sp. CECT 9360]
MKSIERIIIKLILIQVICLLAFQAVFHRADSFLELKKLAAYEGVTKNNYTKIIETFNDEN